jgi:N-acetylglutamate synthase-like GNAT family acetyltransferase
MNPQNLRVRRATVDDIATLRQTWEAMRFSPDDLEKRLTEFQVVENAAGEAVGAMGLQLSGQHALLHSEGYSDFGVADAARQLFWERIQTLASNHGVFRIWTQEQSPFWKHLGFQPPTAEISSRLPAGWKNESDGIWLTYRLKDEEAIAAALEKEFAPFMAGEKSETEKISEKARMINTFITIAGFAIGIIGFGIAIYLFIHRNPFSQH